MLKRLSPTYSLTLIGQDVVHGCDHLCTFPHTHEELKRVVVKAPPERAE